MKILNWASFIVSIALLIALILYLVRIPKRNEKFVDSITTLVITCQEKTFAEGQMRAIKGDVRLNQINDTTYVWVKSPYIDGRKAIKDTVYLKIN